MLNTTQALVSNSEPGLGPYLFLFIIYMHNIKVFIFGGQGGYVLPMPLRNMYSGKIPGSNRDFLRDKYLSPFSPISTFCIYCHRVGRLYKVK